MATDNQLSICDDGIGAAILTKLSEGSNFQVHCWAILEVALNAELLHVGSVNLATVPEGSNWLPDFKDKVKPNRMRSDLLCKPEYCNTESLNEARSVKLAPGSRFTVHDSTWS